MNPLDEVGEEGPESAPLKQPTPAPSARIEPASVPRWVQMVLLPVAIAGAYILLLKAGSHPAAVHRSPASSRCC